jgi:hypothetical protein
VSNHLNGARCIAATALVVASTFAFNAVAQQQVPPAPAEAPTPSLPTPAPSTAPVFPKPDPANFTAASPTKEVVDGFLDASWGYDQNRVWQVEEILKTPVEGVSRVVVYVGDKTGKIKPVGMQFYVMGDGKHIIAGDEILSFGEKPFAEYRAALQQHADGPYRGTASKELELVEFADFQCPGEHGEASRRFSQRTHCFPELPAGPASRGGRRSCVWSLREQDGRQHCFLYFRGRGV